MKHKKKKQHSARPSGARQPARPSSVAPAKLEQILSEAQRLIDARQPAQAIELLTPLLADRAASRSPGLHLALGHAHAIGGDAWTAAAELERAMDLSQEQGLWLPLATLYLELELNAHALHAFQHALKLGLAPEPEIREVMAELETAVRDVARGLDLTLGQVEKGLLALEKGQQALAANNYAAATVSNRQAIRLLGDWSPPHNNLALALFFDGQPAEALAETERVLARQPHNVQALANAVRFLAWTGREAEARAAWAKLAAINPADDADRFKMAEAAAVLDDDERVYALLQPLASSRQPRMGSTMMLYLAVAEANLGKRAARNRLRELSEIFPGVADYLAALEAGRPGPGWASRFAYVHSTDMIPGRRMQEFIDLMAGRDNMSSRRFAQLIARFAARFPQITLVAEKIIWEESQPTVGIACLAAIDTPAAHAALRRFGLSQAGDDQARMDALCALSEAGAIGPDEMLLVWQKGEWREVKLRTTEITEEARSPYVPKVADLLNKGTVAIQQNDYERAVRLFRQAIELEPGAKEAYNNLAAIHARQGDHEKAKEMCRAALDIDPLYVFPRCNLASYLIGDGDLEGAEAMLAPLAVVTRMHPQDMAFYSYTQARVLIEMEEFDQARNLLQTALQVAPDYEPAQELLQHLEMRTRLLSGWHGFFEAQHKRERARRFRLQAKLTTPDPSVAETLGLHSKEVLTAMARQVLPGGGWSALKKAKLLDAIAAGLENPDNVAAMAGDLEDAERAALRQVLDRGGTMPWVEFQAAYDDDLEESPYWQYHEPETVMGRLRRAGLLVETTVAGELLVAVPDPLRPILRRVLEARG